MNDSPWVYASQKLEFILSNIPRHNIATSEATKSHLNKKTATTTLTPLCRKLTNRIANENTTSEPPQGAKKYIPPEQEDAWPSAPTAHARIT
jgi:hypothetical protein